MSSAFYLILHETFSNSYGFALINNLVFSLRTQCFIIGHIFVQSWLIWAQQIINKSSKVPFAKFWSEKCSHKTISKNTAVRICSSK